jgi:hypothetical protein
MFGMKTHLRIGAAALAVALLLFSTASAADAADVRKRRQPKDLSPALKEALFDTLSGAVQPFFGEEDRKKAEGKPYVELQEDLVQYLPNYGPGGQVIVSVKMGGAEWDPSRPETSKGAATGRLKYLVMSYQLKGGKWVEYKKPRWQTQDLGAKGAAKITADRKRRDERQAALDAKKAAEAAAKAAAEKARREREAAGTAAKAAPVSRPADESAPARPN